MKKKIEKLFFFCKKQANKRKGGKYMKAFLILEDGTVFEGTSIGSSREVISEIVFNTSMTDRKSVV